MSELGHEEQRVVMRNVIHRSTGADPGILKGGGGGGGVRRNFLQKGGGGEQFVLQINKIFSKRGGSGPPRPPLGSAPAGSGTPKSYNIQ